MTDRGTAGRAPSAARLRQRLAEGSTTAAALAKTALNAARQDLHNAFVTPNTDGVPPAAQAADARPLPLGPLDGIPIAVKDNFCVAGLRTTGGHRTPQGATDARDAHAVARLRAAGALIIGKTNLDEGALGALTDNPHHGRTTNPLAAGHTAGGSSGGSAAAVAAGIVPLALGSDTLGSVRIPASYCGLFALKPTFGAIGRSGMRALAPSLDTVGVIARSARDLRDAFAVLSGEDQGDPASVPLRSRAAAADPRPGVSVGVLDLTGVALERAVADALAAAVDALAAMGAAPRPITLTEWEPARLARAGLLVVEAQAAHLFKDEIAADPTRFGERFRALLAYGAGLDPARLAEAHDRVRSAGRAVRSALGAVDILLTPTTPHRSFAFAGPCPADQADLTVLANAAGCPAVAVPVARAGLPASVQLLGPRWSELWLCDIAETLAVTLASR